MAEGEGRSKNPFGPLYGTGGQWAEARGFMRTYGGNPYAQAEFVRVLCGLWKNALEGWRPNRECHDGVDPINVAAGVKDAIRYMREQLPEWASLEPVELDPDWMMPPYTCEPHLKEYVEHEVLGGDFDHGGVE